jgi:hypothetical protein
VNLYDVAFTSYHIVDADSIIDLAGPLGRADLVPRMRDRAQRAAAVLNSGMWSDLHGSFVNVLTSGEAVPRWAPTVFSPLFAGVVPRDRVDSMMALAADPAVFCLNATHNGSGGPASAMLLNIGAAGAAAAVSCVSDPCLVSAVLANPGAGAQLQAIAQSEGGAGLLPLTLFAAPALGGASALTTPAFAPAEPQFAAVRTEAYCFAEESALAPVPLTLWHRTGSAPGDECSPRTGTDYVGEDLVNKSTASAAECCAFCEATPGCALWKTTSARGSLCYLKSGAANPTACADCIVGGSAAPAAAPAYATCGTAACNASAVAAGLAPVGNSPMCWASPVASPVDWPCAVALPAIGESARPHERAERTRTPARRRRARPRSHNSPALAASRATAYPPSLQGGATQRSRTRRIGVAARGRRRPSSLGSASSAMRMCRAPPRHGARSSPRPRVFFCASSSCLGR